MAKNIVNLKIDGTSYSARPYGTCTTAAGTAAKAVTCADFSLTTGATILVKFTYANSVASPTLNVNNTGAKPIYYRGAALGSSLYYWGANDTVEFYYNGTQWDLMDVGNTNSTYANYSFGNGYATCATAEATTAKVATYQYYSLATGGIVAVKFTYAVPANATLNINSKGAKSIYHNNAAITAGVIGAGDIATFVYDGTNYVLLAVDSIMTAAEKTKLAGIATGANKYTLPNATSQTLGGVKIGSNISVSSGTISLSKSNVTSALGFTPVSNSTATQSAAGLMSAADKTKLDGITTGATANKGTVTSVATGAGLTGGTITTSGTIKCNLNNETSLGTIGSTSKLYAVGVDANNKLCVKVPWTDNNTTYSVATESTDGLMSKTTAEALSSYSPYTFLYDVAGNVTPGSDKVNVHWTQFCDYVDYSKNDFTENIESHYVDFDIPTATTSLAGVMSAADKQRLDQPFTGLVDGKGETVTMTSSPIDPIVPINEYLNLSLRALPGISVAFATYNSNALVASPHLYKQAQRCAIVLDKSQLSTIDYQTITWRTSAISGYGTPWSEQGGYSLIYIPSGYQSITFKHTSDHYNISAVGVHPTKLGGGYIFNGKWQDANVARTITLNNSDLYVILQAKKADDSDIDPKLDILSELGLSITLNRTDNNICRGFVLNDGTQVYPVFKSAQNNDFNRICYYTNLSGNAAKPKLGDILDCLAAYCHSLPYGYYKIIVQPPSNASEKYGVFDVLVSLSQDSIKRCKYLDVTAMINLHSVSDMSDLPFGHIWGQINTEPDMAGTYSFQSMYNNEWVYERKRII